MSSLGIILLIAAYFLVLMIISHFTAKKADNEAFFRANNQAPWYLVAFGMIGVSLSGVTFLSVPGAVADNQFSYLQMVLGNVVGYWLIIWVLLPLYYRMNLTSIYAYLGERYGPLTQKTGSFFFLLSRIIGASLRLYLVALVLQKVLFDQLGVPFAVSVAVTILLIWIYTQKGGIKTIIWTDTLQTAFMLIGLFVFLFWLSGQLGGISESMARLKEQDLSQVFFFDMNDKRFFLRGFLTGVFITLVMNGLDQDMMQKNLSCRNLADAKRNMFSLSIVFLLVNILFVILGGMLTLYAGDQGIAEVKDKLFPAVAGAAPTALFVIFLLGVIAAAYSSADSALTSLTTAFCVDFGNLKDKSPKQQIEYRRQVHIVFSLILFTTILIFKSFNDDSVVWTLFKMAGFTYGPLLGLYAYGLFAKGKVFDSVAPVIAVISPVVSWFLAVQYKIGFEILLVNGGLTYTGLLLMSHRQD